jgi:hypothetical protein
MMEERIPVMSQDWLLLDEGFIRKFNAPEYSVYSNIWALTRARGVEAVPMETLLQYRLSGVTKKSAKAALEHFIESKVLLQDGNIVSINPRTREWQIPDATPTRRREYRTLLSMNLEKTDEGSQGRESSK